MLQQQCGLEVGDNIKVLLYTFYFGKMTLFHIKKYVQHSILTVS